MEPDPVREENSPRREAEVTQTDRSYPVRGPSATGMEAGLGFPAVFALPGTSRRPAANHGERGPPPAGLPALRAGRNATAAVATTASALASTCDWTTGIRARREITGLRTADLGESLG